MKTNKLKITLIFIVGIISNNLVYSQCPIAFPKSIDICLEGTTIPENVCFQNSAGNLNILMNNGSNLFSFNKDGSFNVNNVNEGNLNSLIINGPNKPNENINLATNFRDIAYKFAGAGSAKIRSFRGGAMGTYLQFLTNVHDNNNPNLDDPKVRMHINDDGKVGIGTITPQALLDVNGEVRIGNSNASENPKLIIVGPNDVNNNASNPIYKRDISYEFKHAGSAKIRSYRGGAMDTYLQFLTNPNGTGPDDPQVRMHINENGNVGIGTTVPQTLLDVNGNLRMGIIDNNNPNKTARLIIQGAQYVNTSVTNPYNYRDISYEFDTAGSARIRSFRGSYMDTYLQFLTNSHGTTPDAPQVRMHINENGKIGIGTVTPQALLDVRGGKVLICDNSNVPSIPDGYRLFVTDGVLSEKFKAAVTSSSQWSDHVFDKGYQLKSLEEVEQYILANKHLPNIPSSEEIIKDGGIDLAQMQSKQMEKIEELTLYLIEMKKEIEDLKKQNKELKEKNLKN